jgi:carotenoid cleavage dioxygenase-like enzyme
MPHVSQTVMCAAFTGDKRYCGEPIFKPRPNARSQADGYVFTFVQDLTGSEEDRTVLEILDGERLEDGPLATITLRDYLPPGLHGSWTDEYLGPCQGEILPSENDIRVHL